MPIHWTPEGLPDMIANGNEAIRAIEAAILEEREACAKIADQFSNGTDPDGVAYALDIAYAIRKRGQPIE